MSQLDQDILKLFSAVLNFVITVYHHRENIEKIIIEYSKTIVKFNLPSVIEGRSFQNTSSPRLICIWAVNTEKIRKITTLFAGIDNVENSCSQVG